VNEAASTTRPAPRPCAGSPTTGSISRADVCARRATIAGQIGHSSGFAFSKAFKRRFGIAPGAFRRSAPQIRA
jgi:AraC-like DNA-binding protein